jgi:methylglyoxal synthase
LNRSSPCLTLIAHDGKKKEMLAFVLRHKARLEKFDLFGTATTAGLIRDEVGLKIEGMLSGPLGGDVQIAARVVTGDVNAVIFLVDPLNPHPHDPDIQAVMLVCNVHDVPLATNQATAELLVTASMI